MNNCADRLAVTVIRLLARAQAWVHWAAFGESIWVSTDGTPYRYSDLGDDHLRNIKRMLRRRGEERTKVYKRLCEEQRRRLEER